ncbi:hypothetical protein D9619_000140 [Psilocybe cf. subviscida]|uniref:Uncharacterized protein n=1 Tax=Psilocybe cf. subviscida TaxID=2480587 RepID=A0A8H5BFP9_9AGAR|nr:hypothetical protein D9619_000140 [Psilocybe cf. subviscida]
MPAPAVYVLAVLGTVGAAFVFKEFVYEPHIAPAIDRWRAEYQATRRRREQESLHEAQSVVQMSERGSRRSKDNTSDDDSSDDENHMWNAGSSSSKLSKDGLLTRRETHDIELDNMAAMEVNEWRNAAPEQVLRQRKNIPEHAMDESIQTIPYSPIHPHVLFDPSSPLSSTPGSQSLFQSPSAAAPPGLSDAGDGQEHISPPTSPIRRSPSPVTASEHVPHQSIITEPQPSPYFVPSLSQSYPQDLDYEHGLELLSPPSSRADSPFSMAELSPHEGLQTLSGTSAFSSVVSSPSPLAMGLGNQSFDAISPPQMHLEPTFSPLRSPTSVTNSARSTTYLSFDSEPSSPRRAATASSSSPSPALGSAAQPTPVRASFIRDHMYADPAAMVPSFPPQSAQDSSALGLLNVPVQQRRFATPAPSEGDLSDLDFMSDYQPSESDAGASVGNSRRSSHAGMSDAGNESDSSWSMAGGSAFGSPMMVPAPRPTRVSSSQSQGLSRGGTVRQSQLPGSTNESSSSR